MKYIAVYTTTGSREEAQRIAKALVERELVACAQISEIESFYRWDGITQNDHEFRLVLKTSAERYKEVEAAIGALHSYTLPAIYALAIEHVYPPFAQWVNERTCIR
ncbi:MAG: divalent-cation tolerance protein CutA [Rhodoferax sp.]|nr:divalent-cation tolerance protein CutA [Rhodoferax sp.]